MRNAIVVLVLAGAVLRPAPSMAAGDSLLVIRTYDVTPGADADRAAGVATPHAILEGAGLNIVWAACEGVTARDADHPCLTRLAPNEISIRFVRLADAPGTRRPALGYSLVETKGRTGALATVYVDRVAALAGAAAMDVATVLGRTIAHEVGHLLLGTAEHARTGVMRAVWSPVMLRRHQPGDWAFAERDAQALRDAVHRRTPLQLLSVVSCQLSVVSSQVGGPLPLTTNN